MSGTSGQTGFKSQVFTANNAGVQLGVCGPSYAQAAGAAVVSGFLHTITVGADSTANTITVYDGLSTSAAVLAKVVTSATTVPQTFIFDAQGQTGLFLVIAGGATPTVTVTYA
jgi:hypothetical protein